MGSHWTSFCRLPRDWTGRALGCLARRTLSSGQAHDVPQAEAILHGMVTQAIIADNASDAKSLIGIITQSGACAVIPSRGNRREPRAFATHYYKHRNLIERFFCRLRQFRRIATRYEKLASRFSAFIALVAAFLRLI